jgi:uncharacterized protein YndB with AHSA1/START domain
MRLLLLAAAAALALGGSAQAKPMPEFPAVDDGSIIEASGDQVLVLSTVMDAPVSEVWRVFTTEEGWKRLGVKMASVDLRQGGVIETSYDAAAKPGQPGNIKNLILAIVPQRLLVIRNVQAPPGFAHAEEFGRTATAVEFLPEGAGRTRVRMWNAGYKPEPAYREVFEMFRKGDAWTLDELRKQFVGRTSGADASPARAKAMAAYPHVADTSGEAGDGTRMIQESIVVHAPVAVLWKAFTDTATYQAWGAPNAEIVGGVGGHTEVVLDPKRKLGDPANLRHELLAYAPERLLVFRNTNAPPGLPGAAVFGDTRIILQFEDLGGGDTRVTLNQTGYGQGAAYDALWSFFHPHNAEMLEQLKRHFEARTVAQETPHG